MNDLQTLMDDFRRGDVKIANHPIKSLGVYRKCKEDIFYSCMKIERYGCKMVMFRDVVDNLQYDEVMVGIDSYVMLVSSSDLVDYNYEMGGNFISIANAITRVLSYNKEKWVRGVNMDALASINKLIGSSPIFAPLELANLNEMIWDDHGIEIIPGKCPFDRGYFRY